MADLLTGDMLMQPVRRAPPPPRLSLSSDKRNNCEDKNGSFTLKLTTALPRSQSARQCHSRIQQFSSVPGTAFSTMKKKAPPPRPPPPKVLNKAQRLGGRRHELLVGGGGGQEVSSDRTSEALLIDLSLPPPRSPSLATSGSDGLSVNSLSSETSTTFFEAPSSWNNCSNGNKLNGNKDNGEFDPFGSIEDNHHTSTLSTTASNKLLDKVSVGGSSFYDTFSSGNKYDSVMFEQNTETGINWSSTSSAASGLSPTEPFNLSEQNSGITGKTTIVANSQFHQHVEQAACSLSQSTDKPKRLPRPTIIRTKQISQQTSNTAAQDLKSLCDATTCAPQSSQTIPPDDMQLRDQETNCLGVDEPSVRYHNDCGMFAIAEYDFESSEHGDLCLKAGDRVELVAAISADWLEGRIGDKQGIFPTAFVHILDATENAFEAVMPPISSRQACDELILSPQQVVALYPFTAELPTDLSLKEGNVVTVTAVVEGGQWLIGMCEGRSGQFPANFVSRVPDNLPVVTL